MDLKDYFASTKGTGVLATADAQGRVNAAIYARPHVLENDEVAFIMPDRLTHANLQQNGHAAYLFIEVGGRARGRRLSLTRTREEKDSDLLRSLRRRTYPKADGEPRYLVFFKVEKILPLVGTAEES